MTEKEQKYYGIINASNTGLITDIESELKQIPVIKIGHFDDTTNAYGQAILPISASECYIIGFSPVQGFIYNYIPIVNSQNQLVCVVKDVTDGSAKINTAVKFDYLYLIK